MDFETYLPAIMAALLILGAGYFNPKMLQSKDAAGNATGHPNYMFLALIAFIGASGTMLIQDTRMYRNLY